MILAGIDEAGYGPLLGPLVVGCCAFEVDGAAPVPADRELPCLWKRLNKYVSRNRLKSGKKLHVNDSKLVYSPAGGLKELERAVLALLTAARCGERSAGANGNGGAASAETALDWLCDLIAFLRETAADAVADLGQYPWYAPAPDERFPLEQETLSVRLFANALREHMERSATRCLEIRARVVFERQLNEMFAATRNKGNALFSVSAMHLDHLLRTYGERDLVIFCDRQGGREHYGSLLRLMFDDWSLEVHREQDGHSDYRLVRGAHVVRLVFCERAEAQCLPVAVASMLSKYLREAMMRRFNAYWKQLLPDVSPTAGYYGDGVRFLNDIDSKRRELGVSDEELIRCR